jgi:hypothetical protein
MIKANKGILNPTGFGSRNRLVIPEGQRLETADPGRKSDLNRWPNKQMREADVTAPPRIGGRHTLKRFDRKVGKPPIPHFISWRMKMEEKRYVGVDLAKRTMEVCILCDGQKPRRYSGVSTGEAGRRRLTGMLRRTDKD